MELYTAGGRRWTYTRFHCLQTPVVAAIPVLYTIAECPLESLLESLLESHSECLLESLLEGALLREE
jgi:hypothetical protein